MDVETGLSRLAKIVEISGLVWAVLCAVVLAFGLILGEGANRWFVVVASALVGIAGYGAAYAVAWIIKGFAQKKA